MLDFTTDVDPTSSQLLSQVQESLLLLTYSSPTHFPLGHPILSLGSAMLGSGLGDTVTARGRPAAATSVIQRRGRRSEAIAGRNP